MPLYVEECGNPAGIPRGFSSWWPRYRLFYRHIAVFLIRKYYRIILFDQRGCGRSTPHCCLEENTTDHLIDDIEAIRLLLILTSWYYLVAHGVLLLLLPMLKTILDVVAGSNTQGNLSLYEQEKFNGFTNPGQTIYILITGRTLFHLLMNLNGMIWLVLIINC